MSTRAPNINRSRIHEDLVQRLAKATSDQRALFPTIRELLCFVALLGYSEGRRIPLDKDAGVEDVSYQQFERGDAEDLIYMIALAETRNPDILREDNEGQCANIFEEYANGGLTVLQEAIDRGGGEHPDRDILQYLREHRYIPTRDEEPDLSGIRF